MARNAPTTLNILAPALPGARLEVRLFRGRDGWRREPEPSRMESMGVVVGMYGGVGVTFTCSGLR